MTFQPVALQYGIPEEAVGRRCMVRGVTYCDRLRRQITFPDCGLELTMG